MTSAISHEKRIKGALKASRGADAVLVTDMKDVKYLCGFTGSSGFILAYAEGAVLVTDSRYALQAEQEVRGCSVHITGDAVHKTVKALSKKLNIESLGFQKKASYGFYEVLVRTGLKLKPMDDMVDSLRIIKDAYELDAISEAVRRAESAFLDIKKYIRVGVMERYIALRLEQALKKKECAEIPFDIIVAAGENSAKPHAKPGADKLKPGDLVTIDWGGECEGYYSDMTRTFLLSGGSDMAKKKKIYNLVLRANKAGITAIGAAMRSKEVDGKARDIITEGGYGEYFGHGLGHGVGLNVHEAPRLSPTSKDKLKENMVITVEPGIYVPGLGGVRIEDMAVVKDGGCRVLTSLPKKLEII